VRTPRIYRSVKKIGGGRKQRECGTKRGKPKEYETRRGKKIRGDGNKGGGIMVIWCNFQWACLTDVGR